MEEVLFGKLGIFSKVEAVTDVIEKGILDYVAHTHRYAEHGIEMLLKLADPSYERAVAKLDLKHVRAADRATYLLNYLYMSIQSNQLLLDNW